MRGWMCSIIHKYILRNQPGTSRPELTAMIIAVQQYHGIFLHSEGLKLLNAPACSTVSNSSSIPSLMLGLGMAPRHQWTNPKENTWAKKAKLPTPTAKWAEHFTKVLCVSVGIANTFHQKMRGRSTARDLICLPQFLQQHPFGLLILLLQKSRKHVCACPRTPRYPSRICGLSKAAKYTTMATCFFFVSSIAATVKAGWNDIRSASGLQEFGFHQSLQIPRKVVQLGIQLLDICT